MAEIANKLLGLKISGQEVWVFSMLVYAYADPWFELSAVFKVFYWSLIGLFFWFKIHVELRRFD